MQKTITKILIFTTLVFLSFSECAHANGVKRVYGLIAHEMGEKVYQQILSITGQRIIESPTVDRMLLLMMDTTSGYLIRGLEPDMLISAIHQKYTASTDPYTMGKIHYISRFLMIPKNAFAGFSDDGLTALDFEEIQRQLFANVMGLYKNIEGSGFFKAFADAGITFEALDSKVLINGKDVRNMGADKVGNFIDDVLSRLPRIEEEADEIIALGDKKKTDRIISEIIRLHFQKREFTNRSQEWIDKEKWFLTEKVIKDPDLTKKWLMRAVALETLKNSTRATQAFMLYQMRIIRLGLLNLMIVFPKFHENPGEIERLFYNLRDHFDFLLEIAPRSAKRGVATSQRFTIDQTRAFVRQVFGDNDIIPDEDYITVVRKETLLLEASIFGYFRKSSEVMEREITAVKDAVKEKKIEIDRIDNKLKKETAGAVKDNLLTSRDGIESQISGIEQRVLAELADEQESMFRALFEVFKILQLTRQRYSMPGAQETNLLNHSAANASKDGQIMAGVINYFESITAQASGIHVGNGRISGGGANGVALPKLF